ncbi:hypothetical protein TNIN_371651, partial [Trichonephila inaurata madagascariensis]
LFLYFLGPDGQEQIVMLKKDSVFLMRSQVYLNQKIKVLPLVCLKHYMYIWFRTISQCIWSTCRFLLLNMGKKLRKNRKLLVL